MADASPDDIVSEQRHLARIARGDADAFEALVKPHTIVLLRYAFGIVKDKAIAEDVVQDVLRWMWEHHAGLQVRGTIRSYLLSAVHNRSLNVIRSVAAEERRASQFAGDDVIPGMGRPLPGPEHVTEHQALRATIRDAIANLPERRRQVLTLRHQELSYPEIAEVLGVSINTVETQARLGFAALREALAPWIDRGPLKKP